MPLVKSEVQTDFRKLRKSLKRAPKHLAPDDIHKLRTRVRRVVYLADAHALPALNKAKLAKPLKRIRKSAGRIRDMDVLTGHLGALHSDSDPPCRTQLLEYLGAKRYRHADRLHRLLKKQGKGLRKDLRQVAKSAAKDIRRQSSKAASKQSAEVLALTAGLSEPAQLNKSNLHPYRLKVKELRDALRMAGGTGDSRFAGELGQCKDAIGEWHDWEELIAIGEKTLNHGSQCRLLQELKSICKQKFDAALRITEKLRTDYARAETPKGKRGKSRRGGSLATKAKVTRRTPPLPIPERTLKAVSLAIH